MEPPDYPRTFDVRDVHDWHTDRTLTLYSDGSASVRIGDDTPRAIQGDGLVSFALAVVAQAIRDGRI